MKRYWAIPIMMVLSFIILLCLQISDMERGGRAWSQIGYVFLYPVVVGFITLILIWIGMAIKAMLKSMILAILK